MKSKSFSNMLTYAQNTFAHFSELPFGEVDSMILSWLSYLHYPESASLSSSDGLPLRDLFCAEFFASMTENVKSPEETLQLLTAVVASPRFRHLTLHHFCHELDHELSKQFAAITFSLADDLHYVAFRGTDCTLIGWKEDFRLALSDPIPSQMRSLDYLTYVAGQVDGTLIIGGHSKGGNLAVFAAANSAPAIRERILAVYTHDGPGFLASDLKAEGFSDIRDRIHKTLPKSSIFGLLFEQECDYEIVESNEISVLQHNLFSWEVSQDHLIRLPELTADAKLLCVRLNNWLSLLSDTERALFIENLFSLLDETNASSFDEFGADLKKNIPIILHSIADQSTEEKLFMLKTLWKFFSPAEKED